MRIGEIELLALSDGVCHMEQDFYLGIDLAEHPELLAPDGRIHMPIGCFLLRTAGVTVLVDAGMGPVTEEWATGGLLLDALAAAGVAPADVDVVLCSHLHIDHIGWLAVDGVPTFPNAVVRFGRDDWAMFVDEAPEGDRGRAIMTALAAADHLDPVDGDLVAVAPGLTTRHLPGHTPGHLGLVVASQGERAFLLGDAVECPLQLTEPDLTALSDVDPLLARRTREALWRELEGDPIQVTGAHFPGLAFGRVLHVDGGVAFAPTA